MTAGGETFALRQIHSLCPLARGRSSGFLRPTPALAPPSRHCDRLPRGL